MHSSTEWKPGQSGNPAGRPKGLLGGRARAIALIDTICEDPTNLVSLKEALQAEFIKGPVKFFKTFVIPLRPAETVGSIAPNGWALLTPAEVCQQMDAATAPRPEDAGGQENGPENADSLPAVDIVLTGHTEAIDE